MKNLLATASVALMLSASAGYASPKDVDEFTNCLLAPYGFTVMSMYQEDRQAAVSVRLDAYEIIVSINSVTRDRTDRGAKRALKVLARATNPAAGACMLNYYNATK